MKNILFNKSDLEYIKKNESDTFVIRNFLSKKDIKEIVKLELNSKYLVDRRMVEKEA